MSVPQHQHRQARPRLTLVAGLFDLAARERNSRRRPAAHYLGHGEFVLALDRDTVFFVDGELAEQVRAGQPPCT
jgi:hypothetical protein